MQWTHELGHIIAGLASGATIERVILDPRTFSMTQFRSTPHPLIAAWGGPLLGVIIGAGIPLLLSRVLPGFRFSLRIIAAFVLLANGLYIGLGAAYPVGDAQSLIMFGSPRWLLAVFGIASMVAARRTLRPVFEKQAQPEPIKYTAVWFLMSMALAAVGLFLFEMPTT
ncbi:MAG: hypothetical protein KDA29_00805 [Phycisphaerales bacterium]|nr:hypothetical protein [Phycisphaerales bacterium]